MANPDGAASPDPGSDRSTAIGASPTGSTAISASPTGGTASGADPDTRSAARLATLVAVPVAVLVGIGLLALVAALVRPPDPEPGPGPGPEPEPAGIATGPVPTQARDLAEWDETVCRALLSQLPDQLDGLDQRPVTAGPEQNAAYGDPPVVVACGVPAVSVLTETVYPLAAVCWVAFEEPDSSVWVTLDREVPVQVTVPASYDGPGQLVAALSGTVLQTIEPTEAPPGCG